MIEIISKKDGFRRCGVAHSIEPTTYPDDRFSSEELKRLQEEPMLIVREVGESSDEGKPEFEITPEYLETKTKKEIVEIAKEIGLAEYLSEKGVCEPSVLMDRTKAKLINLFFEEGFELKGWVPEGEK